MNKNPKIALVISGVIILALAVWAFSRDVPEQEVASTTTEQSQSTTAPDNKPAPTQPEIVAQDLQIPWDMVFLPDNSMLVTERPGNLLHITKDKKTIPIPGVVHIGEGGLLGLVLHPDFSKNHYIYLYSTSRSGNAIVNRVERYKFENETLSDRKVIIEGMRGSSNHDGGRLAFGPDGDLYITVGDADQPNSAQDTNSLNGKILRLKDDGSIPDDNPFDNAVYSYGHRNPQGLAWDSQGQLWATEHGPSGSETGNDEVNRIVKGANYGWPVIRGQATREGMQTPVIESGRGNTWAPSGAVFYNGNLFFAGLRGEALYEYRLGQMETKPVAHLQGQYGRLRTVIVGPDGYLYILTSNRDGRGSVNKGDDKIIRLPKNF